MSMSHSRSRLLGTLMITAALLGAPVSFVVAPIGANVPRIDTRGDVDVSVVAPSVLGRGDSFDGSVVVKNLGFSSLTNVSCEIGTPRLDAVEKFSVATSQKVGIGLVDGSEYRTVSIGELLPGQSRLIAVSGNTVLGSSLKAFNLSAMCLSSPYDRVQMNNASSTSVRLG
jgi:hypothetical protein